MELRIALAGNPNSGKTTLFNALTGSNQFVGNWPGVTVEKKEGKLRKHDGVTITDLPGIYSLSPYTLEEVVARNYLIGERPDAIDVYKRQRGGCASGTAPRWRWITWICGWNTDRFMDWSEKTGRAKPP